MKNTQQLTELYTDVKPKTNEHLLKDSFAEFVEDRFKKMAQYRQRWLERMQETARLRDVYASWLMEGENYDKEVRFPTLRDVERAIVDEIMKTPPKAEVESVRGESKEKAQALNFVISEKLENPYEKREKIMALIDMVQTGVGFRKTNYYSTKKVKTINGKDEVITLWDGVASERIDPRQVYLDEQGDYLYDPKGQNGKRDAIIKHVYAWSTFVDYFGDNPEVNQANFKKVGPLSLETTMWTEQTFKTDRESGEYTRKQGVIVHEYYNQESDTYGVTANGITIINPKPIPNNHGRIPLSMYIFERRQDSIYGISLAELIAPYIYAQDTIFNLEFKGLKLRLQPTLAVDSNLGFNPRIHKAKPGGIWKFAVEPGQNIASKIMPVPLAQGDSNGFYAMDNHLESKMTITTNNDRKALQNSPNELATQTLAKNQSMQKRTNTMVFENEIEAETQMLELMISDIRQYETGKIDTKVKGKNTKRHRRVKVDGYVVSQGEDVAMFEKEQGAVSYFDLTPEAVDVEAKVRVIDMRSKSLLQEQKIGRLLQFIPIATNLISAYAPIDPAIAKKLNPVGILEQTAEEMDMDISRTIVTEASREEDMINVEHFGFIAGKSIPLISGESAEVSRIHYAQHMRFRFKYKNGDFVRDKKGNMIENDLFKKLDKKGKDAYTSHMTLTMQNIIAMTPEKDEEVAQVQTQTKQELPNQQLAQEAPNNKGGETTNLQS